MVNNKDKPKMENLHLGPINTLDSIDHTPKQIEEINKQTKEKGSSEGGMSSHQQRNEK